MIYPEKLKAGDTVGLVAPASPVTEERIRQCVKALEGLGLKVKVGETLQKNGQILQFIEDEKKKREEEKAKVSATDSRLSDQQWTVGIQEEWIKGYLETYYLAGKPEDRAEEVNQMFADPEVKGIICVKGGYGSAQIMGFLDKERIMAHPKIFLGFSDITNLLNTFSQNWGMAAYHGPMASSNMVDSPMDTYTREKLEEMVFTDWQESWFENPAGKAMETLSGGKAQGRLVGGNVTVFTRMTGTFYQADTRDKILFLEDVTEQVPSLDMYITQLEHAGLLKEVKGILLGDFNECENKYCTGYQVQDLLRDRFSDRGIPVIAGLCCGHRHTTGTLPMGAWCEMDADQQKIRFIKK